MRDEQCEFFLTVLESLLGQTNWQVRGLNLNGNCELTDASMRLITDFVHNHELVRVLSVERIKASHSSLSQLFNQLPTNGLIELNVSGIPINYYCVEQLCNVIAPGKSQLRVLHLRNTKLQDISALKLMQHVLGTDQVKSSKIRYLSLSQNAQLRFQFQNGLLKLMQEASDRAERGLAKFRLKFIDLKYCNITQ